MTLTRPIRATRARHVGAGMATLVLALAACSPASQPISTSAAAAGQAAVAPTAAPIPPTLPPTRPTTQAPTPIASQVPAAASQAAAHSPESIHLILHAANDTVGSLTGCTSAGPCQGDFMIGYDPLFDAATGKEVGTFAYECFVVDFKSILYHCPSVTITLTGRGQIIFTEVIEHEPGKPPAIAPITGGTGEFLGATGTVTAKVLAGGGDFVVTLTR